MPASLPVSASNYVALLREGMDFFLVALPREKKRRHHMPHVGFPKQIIMI
jgi:hypothetical protein